MHKLQWKHTLRKQRFFCEFYTITYCTFILLNATKLLISVLNTAGLFSWDIVTFLLAVASHSSFSPLLLSLYHHLFPEYKAHSVPEALFSLPGPTRVWYEPSSPAALKWHRWIILSHCGARLCSQIADFFCPWNKCACYRCTVCVKYHFYIF